MENKLRKLNEYSEDIFYDTREMERNKDSIAAKDEFGVQKVPADWRFGAWTGVQSWLGLSTALAYPLTGALLTLSFGAVSVIIGFIIAMFLVGGGVYLSALKASNEGIGKDLFSRGSYGYYGSLITTTFVGFYLVILFSLETSVISNALHEYFPVVPFWTWVLVTIAILVPLGIYGMVWIAKIQSLTLYLYLIGLGLVFLGLYLGWSDLANSAHASSWWTINPNNVPITWLSVLEATGAWLGAFGFMNMMAPMDMNRLTRRSERKKSAILQVILNGVVNSILIGAMGIYFLAATNGANPDPGVTFVWVLGPVGMLLVFITQLRGNVLNMYLGTLAFDNVVGQITKKKFLRSWLLVPFVFIAFIVVLSPFLDYYPTIATIAGVVFAAWVGSIYGESLIVRRLYKIPRVTEIRRGYLPNVNLIGFISLVTSIVIGLLSVAGFLGGFFKAVAVLFTLVLAFTLPIIVARSLGKDKVLHQYYGRLPSIPNTKEDTMTCFKTGETHHKSNFVQCPFYDNQWITSVACASESQCGKMCQSQLGESTVKASTT